MKVFHKLSKFFDSVELGLGRRLIYDPTLDNGMNC